MTSAAPRRRIGRRPADPDGVSTQDNILAVAEQVFADHGYVAASLREIAQRADVTQALIIYYFGSKQGLLAALLERDIITALTQLDALLAWSASPTEKMERHIEGLIRLFVRFPYLARLMTDLAHHGEEETRQHIADTYLTRIFQAYERLIAEGVAAGEFVETDHRFFYFGVVGACDLIFSTSFVMKYVHGVDAIDDDIVSDYAKQIKSLLMNGLRRRDPPSAA